jgi:hypothetical protein
MMSIKSSDVFIKNVEGIICCDKTTYTVDTKYCNKLYLPPNFLTLVESMGYTLNDTETITFYK